MIFHRYKFKNIISKKGLSSAYIRKRLNITKSTLWNWVNGKSTPREINIRKLAKLLEININEISDLKEKELDNALFKGITENSEGGNWLKQTNESFKKRIEKMDNVLKYIYSTQEELSESRIVVNALLDNMNIIFYIKDHKNKYITANNKYIEQMKLNDNFNISGKDDFDLMKNIDAKKNNNEDLLLINSNKKVIYEGYIPNSRKKKWAIITKNPIVNDDDEVCGLAVTYTDITDRKLAERNIKVLDTAIGQSESVIAIVKIDKRQGSQYLYLSKSIESVYGYPREAFLNDNNFFWNNCIHNDDLERIRKMHLDLNFSKEYEYKIITKSNEIKWMKSRSTKVEYQNLQCYMLIGSDITKSKKEKALKELVEANINMMTEAVLISDIKTGMYVYSNEKAIKLTGINSDKLLQTKRDDLIQKYVLKEDFAIANNHLDPLNKNIKFRVKKNNVIYWLEVKQTIINYLGVKCLLSIFNDITEIKKIEDRNKMLIQSINQSNMVTWIGEVSNINETTLSKTLYISDSVLNLTGYSSEYYYKKTDFFFELIFHDDRERMEKEKTMAYYKYINNKNDYAYSTYRYRIKTKADGIKWVESTTSIIEIDNKNYYISTTHGINEKIKSITESGN